MHTTETAFIATFSFKKLSVQTGAGGTTGETRPSLSSFEAHRRDEKAFGASSTSSNLDWTNTYEKHTQHQLSDCCLRPPFRSAAAIIGQITNSTEKVARATIPPKPPSTNQIPDYFDDDQMQALTKQQRIVHKKIRGHEHVNVDQHKSNESTSYCGCLVNCTL